MPLTDTEQQMLDLESRWWKHPGARDTEIHARFGMTPTRYYQALNALVDRPEAHAADPLLITRLRRLRSARRRGRSPQILGKGGSAQ